MEELIKQVKEHNYRLGIQFEGRGTIFVKGETASNEYVNKYLDNWQH